jgi:outer membrane protein OmpA-like peptidoglycan-associated protein
MFGPWSVLLDQAALAVIEAAAAQANRQPEATITLAEYLDPAGPQAIADLSRLRAQLIEDQLAAQGVARERISRVRRAVSEVPGMAQESQRVDILLGP